MTPTIDNSNLPKFPPSPPITQWMAGAICGRQRKPYCSSVATRAPPIKSHPDRIGHLPSLCLSTTKKMLFIIWRIENTWGEIEKFCNIYDQCLLHSIFTQIQIYYSTASLCKTPSILNFSSSTTNCSFPNPDMKNWKYLWRHRKVLHSVWFIQKSTSVSTTRHKWSSN